MVGVTRRDLNWGLQCGNSLGGTVVRRPGGHP
jgi:hypothetical protein